MPSSLRPHALVTASVARQSILVLQRFLVNGITRHDGLPRFARNDEVGGRNDGGGETLAKGFFLLSKKKLVKLVTYKETGFLA
jgi:hypothetical protein